MLRILQRISSIYNAIVSKPVTGSMDLSEFEELSPSAAIKEFRQNMDHDSFGAPRLAKWLDISVEGFSEQQQGRPLAHLVKELLQNALDAITEQGTIVFGSSHPNQAKFPCFVQMMDQVQIYAQ